ncbi:MULTISPECIES: hypothetical protein [Streptomyces]|uniref:hypothetical protein n=1 Tax=Streptomyces TaxID=1883 RepID=UPI000A91AF29|nr:MULTISPECIES: hypothetical protein [Streptomyces]
MEHLGPALGIVALGMFVQAIVSLVRIANGKPAFRWRRRRGGSWWAGGGGGRGGGSCGGGGCGGGGCGGGGGSS